MSARTTIAAALVALSTLGAAPASAGGLTIEFGVGPHWGQHHARLSPQEVRWMLRSRDYRQINFIDRRGSTYQLTARKGGRDYFVVVSAWSGSIIHRHRI